MSLGALQASRGAREIAEQTFKRAVQEDGKSVEARLALAQFYWISGRLPESEQVMKSAIAGAPQEQRLNSALAIFYLYTGRRAEAEPYLRTAAQAEPKNQAVLSLADYYIAGERLDDAAALLTPLTADTNLIAQASIRLALIAQMRGRGDEAIRVLDQVLLTEPKNPMVLTAKSEMLRRQRRFDEALKVAESASETDKSSAHAAFVRGQILAEKGLNSQAEQAFNDVLRLESPRGSRQGGTRPAGAQEGSV